MVFDADDEDSGRCLKSAAGFPETAADELLSCCPGDVMGPLYSKGPGCQEALAQQQNPPSRRSGFVTRLKQVLNRSEASTTRIMKLTKATGRMG